MLLGINPVYKGSRVPHDDDVDALQSDQSRQAAKLLVFTTNGCKGAPCWMSALLCTLLYFFSTCAYGGKVAAAQTPFALHPALRASAPQAVSHLCALHHDRRNRRLKRRESRRRRAKRVCSRCDLSRLHTASPLGCRFCDCTPCKANNQARAPPISLDTGAGASDGIWAFDHGGLQSNDDGSATLARHRQADRHAAWLFFSVSRGPADVRHAGAERCYLWQYD